MKKKKRPPLPGEDSPEIGTFYPSAFPGKGTALTKGRKSQTQPKRQQTKHFTPAEYNIFQEMKVWWILRIEDGQTPDEVISLASIAEANAGVITTKAVTPAGLLIRLTGSAILGGDLTGDTRGANALDIQSSRNTTTQVASGARATAVGYRNTASGPSASAIGYNNTASAYYSSTFGVSNTASNTNSSAFGSSNTASAVYSSAFGSSNTASNTDSSAFGYNNTASGSNSSAFGIFNTASNTNSSAFGFDNTASGSNSNAFGYKAKARIEKTTNICGPQIIRKDDGETSGIAFESFCGVETILMSKEIDLETVADQTLTLPSNCKFWLNEIGLIATSIDTISTQPTIRFGITGSLAKHNAAAITTDITAAGKREIETPLVPEDGETSLTAGVTVAAVATIALGRFYWKGMLIEDE